MPAPLPIAIEPFTWSNLNLEQTFQLIDRYIPLNICRKYEILPLILQGRRLTLGIVDPQRANVTAIIHKLLSRGDLQLVGQQLDLKTYQLILSSYLKYHQSSERANQQPKSKPPAAPKAAEVPLSERATLVMEDGPPPMFSGTPPQDTNADSEKEEDTAAFAGDTTALQAPVNTELSEFFRHMPAIVIPKGPVQMRSPQSSSGFNPDVDELQVSPQYLNTPLGNLTHLPAAQLYQELLGRILTEGIGRLYFENHAQSGRILLSESGLMKGMLSGIPQATFHGVLDEFKRLAHLPPGPVDRPKKVEMEQYYQGERILLRLRVMPGQYGEEGTLQVLRGQALVFYQQQQMDELGNDAVESAQRLERKLRHIYLRSQINPASLNALDELYSFCDRIREQLDNIRRRQ
ncbi:hypothetical protein NIES970_24240 [[Synechococcus] sp. NIES-970]|uniref:GspE/PulE/PilB domain-containing protein n=1 Tax=Picosynechococcus sp. NKBG15041c TaxID=1407650 RepID=UPI000415E6A2|nr:hypothetical protein [Picosynechococcus sp. NKBG15041c]BAW97472.1 hypothetical protein NIES970_24240 [[Synechococcus] sp. NIES-970]